MPALLPPISRRSFLRRSLAAGAGLTFAPGLLAETRPTDPDSWALLSDSHLAADRSQLGRGVNVCDHFNAATREILALPKRPAGLFINGDCAFSSGEPGDYALLAELLRPIRADQIPVCLALGNHDHREHFWNAFFEEKAAERPVADHQVALLATPRLNWIILDSLETTLATPGLLGKDQLGWLARTLDNQPKKPAVVMVHHNPGLSGNSGLKDTVALFEVIRPRTQVKAYMYGHTHQWKVEQDNTGLHLINLPSVSYVFQEAEPAGWVHAAVSKKGMRLELRSLDPKHRAHGQVFDLDWRA